MNTITANLFPAIEMTVTFDELRVGDEVLNGILPAPKIVVQNKKDDPANCKRILGSDGITRRVYRDSRFMKTTYAIKRSV